MKRMAAWVMIGWLFASGAPAVRADIVEEIVAKVNSEIITKSELERARVALRQELQQQLQGQSLQLEAAYAQREKELLSQLIDNALLLQRGKDMNINVDTESVRRMNAICQQMGLKTLEECERAITAQGMSFEDFKTNIKNQLTTQQVIGREVGSRIQITQEKMKKFYDENKQKFDRPEEVRIRAILLSIEGKEGAELEAVEKLAKDLLEKIRKGGNFAELAQQNSDHAESKPAGGDMGFFQRGLLARELEEAAFRMKKGEVSDLIRSRNAIWIIKVEEKHEAGIPPMAEVEQEIQEAIYVREMQPALREFLAKLREEAYIEVKPGYVDTGASGNPDYARLIPRDITEEELIAPKDRQGRRSWLPPFRRKSPKKASPAAPVPAQSAQSPAASSSPSPSTPPK